MSLTLADLPELTVIRLEQYLRERGVVSMTITLNKSGWTVAGEQRDGTVFGSGPHKEMQGCLHYLILRLDKA